MSDRRFLFSVKELLRDSFPPGTAINLPAQGPGNAPQLVAMNAQMHPKRLALLGAIVATEMAVEAYVKGVRDLDESLDFQVVARAVENAQYVLAGRLRTVNDELTDLNEVLEAIQLGYEGTPAQEGSLDPLHGSAWMAAKAAQHLGAATSLIAMGPAVMPNWDNAVSLEISHAIMYAAQSQSRSQPTIERIKLDMLTMVEPGREIVQFLADWWAEFVARVTVEPEAPPATLSQIQARSAQPDSWNQSDRGNGLADALDRARPLNYPGDADTTQAWEEAKVLLAEVDEHYAHLRLTLGPVVFTRDDEGAQLLIDLVAPAASPFPSGALQVAWKGKDFSRPSMSFTLRHSRAGRELVATLALDFLDGAVLAHGALGGALLARTAFALRRH